MTIIPDTNIDLTVPAIVQAMKLEWHASPSPTVWRKSLYRQGGEFGPVTSLVRYDAKSHFARHAHPEGEEILVLEGVFSDEHGDYPAGTFLLNPPGSAHTPFSEQGCVLFVHLKQYRGEHREQAVVDTRALAWQTGGVPDIQHLPLYQQSGFPERISLERWAPGAQRELDIKGGAAELLVVDGEVKVAQHEYGPHTWFRLPAHSGAWIFSSTPGCTVYLRLG